MKEEDLKKNYKAIVIGGSAGSFQVLSQILNKIPLDFHLPIIICCHRLKDIRTGFIEALALKSIKPIEEPEDKDKIKMGKVYLAPANYHMSVELGHSFSLSTEEMYNSSRPSIDITFETAAYTYKEKLIGILLTGANKDGALGMKSVKKMGGLTIVQDPLDCAVQTMPRAALSITPIDYIMNTERIIKFFQQLNKYQSNEKSM
jgi:two-component system chemotaxis response regulator CheB